MLTCFTMRHRILGENQKVTKDHKIADKQSQVRMLKKVFEVVDEGSQGRPEELGALNGSTGQDLKRINGIYQDTRYCL